MSKSKHDEVTNKLHELGAPLVHALLTNHQAFLVDVREPGEFEAERIPGALLFPLSEFDPACLPLDTKKRLIFHCGSGKRSAQAAQKLFAMGIGETSHLVGGIKAWKESGLPVIEFDPATGRTRRTGAA